MFRFEDPQYLWLMLVVPILVVAYIMTRISRRKRQQMFGELRLVRQLTPGYSKYRPWVKFWLLMSIVVLVILMLARPQTGAKVSTEKVTGIETVIAIDISNSMMAEDIAPSRLDRSKMIAENIIDNIGDGKVALVVFAGSAFVQMPLTTDIQSAKMFLNGMSPSYIEEQGTNIADAIGMSLRCFSKDKSIGKAIVVITDGEDHEGGAESMASKAQAEGAKVFVLGIGSTSGSPIPTGNNDYLKDSEGNVVMSALNEDMCKSVAKSGKGIYIKVGSTGNVEGQLDRELAKLQKGEISGVVYKEFNEQYQLIAVVALLLMVIEAVILERKTRFTERIKLFSRK